jgi:penicillin-binding protein 1A
MKEDDIDEEEIKKTFYLPVRMKVFAWNAKRQKDTIMTPYDSIRYHKQILQTSFAAMDPHTGEVKAYVGGIDFKWFKYDHVTAMRQVGSSFKPFIYTLAVEEAGYTPETVIPGGALTLGGKTISGGGGTLAYCLAHSKNIAAWRLIGQIGVKRTIEFVQNCGIKTKIPPYYSIALGAAEIPMLEMMQGYTMFPDKGLNVEPIMVNRIEDKSGNLLEEFSSTPKQVISEGDAYIMVQLMKGVIQFGTARVLNNYSIGGVERAGKTGTTNNNTDGWFIGYTPELLAATWVGCDDPFIRIYANNAGGAEMSAPKWGIFMSKVYADKKLGYGKIKTFEKPADMDKSTIDADPNSFNRLFMEGDSTTIDSGNGDADDFMNAPINEKELTPTEEIKIESEIPNKDKTTFPKIDTTKKQADKKDNKQVLPPGKAIDDKKKPVKPVKTNNDY